MKAVIYTVLIFNLYSCVTFEFFPQPEYINLKKSNVESVEIIYKRPEIDYEPIGTLVVKNFNNSMDDEIFLEKIQNEARIRGAEGAWVQHTRLQKYSGYQTNEGQGRHALRGRNPGVTIDRNFSELRIIIFNYKNRP